ncbi:hypothetical protein BC332_01049 [Capsicum chinense]|nr:hypothetical protein BC332_01049 [Capsicum chinense]
MYHQPKLNFRMSIAEFILSSYNELVVRVMWSRDLDYAPSNMVISYLIHSGEKVNPTITNNDARVSLYMMDVDADGFRPILRINIVERSFEVPMNSSPSLPQRSTVDDDLNNYESNEDYSINMEDDWMHMEDISSDTKDAEEDCGMVSQPGHFLFDRTNFYRDQTFSDKK